MEIPNTLKYVVPKGTIVFRVETSAVVNPPYRFYAYFTGNFREQFRVNKKAWYSRCSNDVNERTRVSFLRLKRDVEVIEMSMNNYAFDDPTNEEIEQANELIRIVERRILDTASRSCIISAIKQVYNIQQEVNPLLVCSPQVDYTLAAFVYSHLDVDGWIRLAEEGPVTLDEVMLVQHVLQNDMQLIAEYDCSILTSEDNDAIQLDLFRRLEESGNLEQPEPYRKLSMRRRNESKVLQRVVMESIQTKNDSLHSITEESDSLCIKCQYPCSTSQQDDPSEPFCSLTCQYIQHELETLYRIHSLSKGGRHTALNAEFILRNRQTC